MKGKLHYLPIQKFAKIFPSTSSLVISPVISDKWSILLLISTESKSPETLSTRPSFTSSIALSAFIKAS